MSEAEALVLDRSLRFAAHETALEQGCLLAELEQRFAYSLDELARRFDRSVSWVSRRLALAELLPEAIQQQVRDGQISAHVAMKFLAPMARVSLQDCRQMAVAFAKLHCNTRQAAQLYAAWRDGTRKTRELILAQPEAAYSCARPRHRRFRQKNCCAIWKCFRRSPSGPAGDWPRPRQIWTAHSASKRGAISTAPVISWSNSPDEWKRSRSSMLRQAQRTTILELDREKISKHEIARILGISRASVRKVLRSNSVEVPAMHRAEKAEPYGQQILQLFPECKGNLVRVHEELAASGATL